MLTTCSLPQCLAAPFCIPDDRLRAIGSLTQHAAELLDSHDSLSSSTDINPPGFGRNAGSTALHERFTTCHAHALARHTFVSAHHSSPQFTPEISVPVEAVINAVVILRNYLFPASNIARTANYHGFASHNVRPQDLPCGRRILDFSIADDLWVNAQHMRLPVVYLRDCCLLVAQQMLFVSWRRWR